MSSRSADRLSVSDWYHEMLDSEGTVRPHWHGLFDELMESGPEHMRRRLANVQHQIFENGITYNVYADPKGVKRPWELDLLPFILPEDEWSQIEAAVVQRATLLNRVLADVYGNQYLLREGLLPPALVYGHAGFLRPAHGVTMPGGVHLHFYAVDITRAPDGRWWVISDCTQAPSGAGYALENRLVISRAFPDLFRDLKVQHLAGFFRTLQESLTQWAPADPTSSAPRIVLLTPGPYNETYFEHTYLARYLGFPLVEGHDLTVRNGCVWMKTLDGLKRVHVILRRLDDDFCDPLELRDDSTLGVPGLMQAARAGNVLIANGLGSSLLESGALYGYLPSLCERIMGGELLMPSVATWWCGESAAMEDALTKLDRVVIKGTFPQLRFKTVIGADLNDRDRVRLMSAIRARPYNYVAQEWVNLSRAPTWEQKKAPALGSRALVLRVYAVATPSGYMVMPGGLTRVAGNEDPRVIAMQRGGASKDTWILTKGHVDTSTLLRSTLHRDDLVRSGESLSSRMVENLLWMGRYTERCDNIARLLRVAFNRLIGTGNGDAIRQNQTLMAVCQGCGLVPDDAVKEEQADISERALLIEALTDPNNPCSFAANLRQLLRIGSLLRERLSLDNWRTLNRLSQELEVQQARYQQDKEIDLGDALAFLDQVITVFMTLAGFALDGMTRDMGWSFLSMGRRIERLQFYSTALAQLIQHQPVLQSDLEWMLELADSIITYRSRYMMQPQLLPVLDLLVMDDTNPRAILFQVKGLVDYMAKVKKNYGAFGSDEINKVFQQIKSIDLEMILNDSADDNLAGLLSRVYDASLAVSNQLNQRFFNHVIEQHTAAR